MRARRCGCCIAALLAAVVDAHMARAAPDARAVVAVPAVTKVTVVDPPADDRILVEAGMRIRAELDAANLSNRAVTCAGGVGSAGCDATASAAAIALSRQDGLATIRVIATLPDGYELHRLIRVAPPAGGDDPAVLAMRAVELLRDIYLDVPRDFPHRDAPKPPAQPPRPVIETAPPVTPPDHKALRMFLGASVLGGRRGLGPAIAPVLGATLPLGSGLSLSGAAAGPFSRLVGDAMTGTATTTQALAMLGVRYELELRAVSPFVAIGTGVHYIRAEGTPTPETGEAPMSTSAVSPLFAAGAGVAVWFRRWLAATVQVEEFYTQPITDVIITGVVVGRAGGPSLLAQVGLLVSLGER
jgi:hypothetical protein